MGSTDAVPMRAGSEVPYREDGPAHMTNCQHVVWHCTAIRNCLYHGLLQCEAITFSKVQTPVSAALAPTGLQNNLAPGKSEIADC